MAQEIGGVCSVRLASAEEVARIEATRKVLRGSVRWTRVVVFWLPSALSLAVIASTLWTYPGGLSGKLFAIVAGFTTSFGVFTAPMLLSRHGRPLSVARGLERDREGGLRIERVRGVVTWSRSARSYVATSEGRRLVSPEFTTYRMIPAFWESFEGLAPGAYWFDVLPASGLVVAAEPLPGLVNEREPPGDAALRAAFRNSLEDVAMNRQGCATARQRWRLAVRTAWLSIALPLFSLMSWLTVWEVMTRPAAGALLSLVIALGVTAFVLRLAARVAVDLALGELQAATGRVSFTYGRTDATGSVGAATFTVSNARARAFGPDLRYRVFIFRCSRYIAGAELAEPSSSGARERARSAR